MNSPGAWELRELLSPAAYPHPAPEIHLIQTHISFILLAGELAYKIKKPVDLGFVDYTTLERRRTMCEEEVRLNRRLCDGVYLGVVSIARTDDGHLRIGGSGDIVEYAVHMKRVPEDRMMPTLLDSGGFTQQHLRDLAARLAQFHDGAAANSDTSQFGTVEAIARNWEENFGLTRRHVGRTITQDQIENLVGYVQRFLGRNGDLFLQRADAGRVRDCHGDLRSDSVVIWPNGSICMMDCIEFAERLRCGDVASDVAFLTMDVEFRGYRRIADELLAAYMEHASDETLTVVLNFYRAYRAYVRGKVESILYDEPSVGAVAQQQAGDRAKRYFELAAAFASTPQPALVIMSGLSGSGKSWIASALAGRISAALIRSDVVRRGLVGEESAAPGPFGVGAYAERDRERVYDAMFGRASRYLDAGRGVVLDATFATRSLRTRARDIAVPRNLPFLAIEVTAEEHVIRQRLEARSTDPGFSDARWDIYIEQRGRFESLDDVSPIERVRLDSGKPLDELVHSAMARLHELI